MGIIPFPMTGQHPAPATEREPVRFDPPAITQAERNDPLAIALALDVVAASSR